MKQFSFQDIDDAYTHIKDKIVKTPLITNNFFNNLLESNIYFKCETFQHTGSFKYRGASHKISKLSKNNKIVAYSSGNHAQAVALAAFQKNINAKIIMPKNAPKIKINNTIKYGAEIVLYDTKTENREKIAEKIAFEENRTLIKPYDDYDIISGQGTAGIEIFNDLNKLSIKPDLYLCCCGGGGLIAGTSTYLKRFFPNIKSYSVEPNEFNDTKLSLEKGRIIQNHVKANSFCDALLAPKPGNITFSINKKNLNGGLSVSDKEVSKTIISLAEHLKIISEPGGAVAAAAVLNKKINIKNKNVIVMISGGNIDTETYKNL